MTTDELEKLAATDGELTDDTELPDVLLFLTLRELYRNFRSGAVNRDRAKREKSRIYVAYYALLNQYKATKTHLKIKRRLEINVGELYKSGCPTCQKLIRIFDGIERVDIPEDIKTVNAINENLRGLVKERSERNAELATTIDRVRWTIDSDRTTEEKLERIKEIVCTTYQ